MEPAGYPEHQSFDPRHAVTLRVEYLVAVAEAGEDSQAAKERLTRISILDAKMTHEESQRAWDEAFDEFAKETQIDEGLKERYGSIGSAVREAYQSTGDEISELARELDKHLGRSSGQAGEEEKK